MFNSKFATLVRLALVALVFGISSVQANPLQVNNSGVSVNGVPLSLMQLAGLERQLGGRVAPGNYLLRGDGCWLNLNSGASGCLGSNSGGDVHSRYGSGSRSSDGSWNHWSNAAEGAVGGTSDGCIYTSYGWSNC